jgi:Phage portal protein, SPP1 Gp6-like
MFDTIRALIPRDPDYPPRVAMLDLLRRVLNGTLYDVLPYQFHEERSASGDYIPLRDRRPSVRYALSRIVVEDSVALLFSEGHFPAIDSPDADIRGFFADLVQETGLNEIMIDAAIRGSIGSVALLLRILKGRVFVSVLDSIFLTPVWQAEAPDTLASVTERYKVQGSVLAAQGYAIEDPGADYWFMRCWDAEAETWFQPWPVSWPAELTPEIDAARTLRHDLGFVPLVWIRNLPGGTGLGGGEIDGAATFRAAIETGIEIDYQLSQAGRGLKYSSDPTLLIKEPATPDREIIKGAGNALVVSKDGDARLLEIGGTAANAVIDYVRALREFALESVHGNRASADRIAAAQSGRALELMNQGLIWLADNLRISYGESGLLTLARMIARAAERYTITVMGRTAPPMSEGSRLSLRWRPWYPPSPADRLAEAQTLQTLCAAGLISRETATRSLADTYGIADVAAELSSIAKDTQTS